MHIKSMKEIRNGELTVKGFFMTNAGRIAFLLITTTQIVTSPGLGRTGVFTLGISSGCCKPETLGSATESDVGGFLSSRRKSL